VNTALRRAACLAAVLAVAACAKKEDAIDAVKRETAAEPAADPVQMTVTCAKPSVALGDDIAFHFKLTNTAKTPVKTTLPLLDQRSISFRVTEPDGKIATVTRIHGTPNPAGKWDFEPMDAKDLAPGESAEGDVSTVAVEAGKLGYAAMYYRAGAPAVQTAPAIEITVTPPDAARPHLGVQLDTSHGSYTARLRPDVAYNTCESFATLVKRGYFAGAKFHRIIAGFMAQGGDPKGSGEGGPGYYIPLEANVALRHTRGVLSMARMGCDSFPRIGQDTAGSQFFLMFTPHPDLDRDQCADHFGYTAFGEMTDGDETLTKLEATAGGPATGDRPKENVQIQAARLVTLP
jgi:cyclophilin family peptidyl-prolyl cis-trans isomerase